MADKLTDQLKGKGFDVDMISQANVVALIYLPFVSQENKKTNFGSY
jgi:hypothetical protein